METDHIFFHELHKKRRSQLVDVITILIPILVLLFAITKLSQNNDKYNYIYMFCAIILLSTAIDRKKTVDIKLKSDGIEIPVLSVFKNQKHRVCPNNQTGLVCHTIMDRYDNHNRNCP